ncbi:MAG: anthranilate phosphoribosyltransferase [Balneolaceae bacterium]
MAQQFKDVLETLSAGTDLSREDARFALESIVNGDVSHEEVAAFLFGMRQKGETIDELTEFVKVMRDAAVRVEVDTDGAVDLCGTGGDRSGTFNISTAAMLVVAGAGVPVLKHGNRSVSSRCGSADVLEELGVVATLQKEGVEEVFRETGMAFMFAPNFHPAMKYVMPARKALKIRTFFNVLGPLLNPADVKRQVIGAFNRDTAETMVQILSNLETEQAYTLHARDGLDEVSLSDSTEIFELKGDGTFTSTLFNPEAIGFSLAAPDELSGGDSGTNADIIQSILDGSATDAQAGIVLLNAAFAIHVSGAAATLKEAKSLAEEAVQSGSAKQKLKEFAEATQDVQSSQAGG